jgi:hypothetical protein
MPDSENARSHWSAGMPPCHIELAAKTANIAASTARATRRMRESRARFSSSVISNPPSAACLISPREGTILDERVRATVAVVFQGIPKTCSMMSDQTTRRRWTSWREAAKGEPSQDQQVHRRANADPDFESKDHLTQFEAA